MPGYFAQMGRFINTVACRQPCLLVLPSPTYALPAPALEVGDVWSAPPVGPRIHLAPLRRDEFEVAAAVFPLVPT